MGHHSDPREMKMLTRFIDSVFRARTIPSSVKVTDYTVSISTNPSVCVCVCV